MNILISIVIPVYNVANYVEKCVRTCFDHKLPEEQFEVIAINDGSKDNSLEICKKLQHEYPNFKIITQKNKGLSGARNTGLRQAKGKFVWFVDSDDWITSECLMDIKVLLEKYQPDLLWLGHDVIFEEKPIRSYIPNKIDEPISGGSFFQGYLSNLFYIWKFIYRKEFLIDNKLQFYEGILYEDLEFTPRALQLAKICITLPKVVYHYLIRQESIANSIKEKNITDRFFILERLSTFVFELEDCPEFCKALEQSIVHTFSGTVKMAARTGLPLPLRAFDLLKSIKKMEENEAKSNIHFKLISLNLSFYFGLLTLTYDIKRTLAKIKML